MNKIDLSELEMVLQTGGEVSGPVFKGNPMYEPDFTRSEDLVSLIEHELDYDYLQYLLEDAISRSVPLSCDKIGVFLSGGIDSTLLLYLLKKQGLDIIAYHLDWHFAPRSEVDFARMAAKHIGVELKVIDVSPEAQIPFIESSLLETKTPDYSITAVYMGFREMAKDGIRSAFNALGLDEILAGYPIHRKLLHRSAFHIIPSFGNSRLLHGLGQRYGTDKTVFTRSMFISPQEPLVRSHTNHFAVGLYERYHYHTLWKTVQRWTLNQMITNYATAIMRAGLPHDVEIIYPYIDPALIYYCTNLSPKIQYNKRPARCLIRDAFDIPDALVARGENWRDPKKYDKYAFGGTIEPYIQSIPFMKSILPDYYIIDDVHRIFTDYAIREYLPTTRITSRVGFQIILFMKILELLGE